MVIKDQTRIILVTHLPSVRRRVQEYLGPKSEFGIVGVATNLMQAFSLTEELKPNIALVSPDFTHLAEFEMVRALFSALDTRWLSITDEKVRNGTPSQLAYRDYGLFSIDIDEGESAFIRALRSLSNSPQSAAKQRVALRVNAPQTGATPGADRVVLIGSSTGGVDALTEILSRYPENCPPTFIVQHTGRSFGESLVRLLNSRCPAKVVAARNGIEVVPGMVCLGAGQDAHMLINNQRSLSCRLKPGTPISGHIPSVDEMFKSALPMAKKVVACLLTGMGRDGAQGLFDLRSSGARTFVQDEGTSIVYGMPKAAWELGAAEKRVPINRMTQTIFEACRLPQSRTETAQD